MTNKRARRRPFWLEIASVLLTPLVIAASSYYVTLKINERQQENTQIIANAQIENAARIAEGETVVAKLDQIKDLFGQVFVEGPDTSKKQIILALSAYGHTALPFLIRALEYGEQKDNKIIVEASRKSITIALGSTQLHMKGIDLSHQTLRKGQFRNLNLEDAKFCESNLYMADLSDSHLMNADFSKADLHGAIFKGTNLTNADFTEANVRQADFRGAKLDKTNFRKARNLKDAKFRPSSLKDGLFCKENLIELMEKYETEIKRDKYGETLFQILSQKYNASKSCE